MQNSRSSFNSEIPLLVVVILKEKVTRESLNVRVNVQIYMTPYFGVRQSEFTMNIVPKLFIHTLNN